jgi:hypothetical protein
MVQVKTPLTHPTNYEEVLEMYAKLKESTYKSNYNLLKKQHDFYSVLLNFMLANTKSEEFFLFDNRIMESIKKVVSLREVGHAEKLLWELHGYINMAYVDDDGVWTMACCEETIVLIGGVETRRFSHVITQVRYFFTAFARALLTYIYHKPRF